MSSRKVLINVLRVNEEGDGWSSSTVEGIRVSVIDKGTNNILITCDVSIKNAKNLLSTFDKEDIEWGNNPISMEKVEYNAYYDISMEDCHQIIFLMLYLKMKHLLQSKNIIMNCNKYFYSNNKTPSSLQSDSG